MAILTVNTQNAIVGEFNGSALYDFKEERPQVYATGRKYIGNISFIDYLLIDMGKYDPSVWVADFSIVRNSPLILAAKFINGGEETNAVYLTADSVGSFDDFTYLPTRKFIVNDRLSNKRCTLLRYGFDNEAAKKTARIEGFYELPIWSFSSCLTEPRFYRYHHINSTDGFDIDIAGEEKSVQLEWRNPSLKITKKADKLHYYWNKDTDGFDHRNIEAVFVSGSQTYPLTSFHVTSPVISHGEMKSYPITVSFDYVNGTVASSFTVIGEPNIPVLMTASWNDNDNYYENFGNNKFALPKYNGSAVSFELTYADGTSKLIPSNNNWVSYYLSEDGSKLVVGESVIPYGTDKIYAYFDYDVCGAEGSVFTTYNIAFKDDAVVTSDLQLVGFKDGTSATKLTLGRKYDEYSYRIIVSRASGNVEIITDGISIVGGNKYIESGNVTARAGYVEVSKTLDTIVPSVSGIEMSVVGNLSSTVSRGVDVIDITSTEFRLSYSDDKGELEKKTDCSFARNGSVAKTFIVRSATDSVAYDGTSAVTTSANQVTLEMTAYGEYGTSYAFSHNVKVIELKDISFIRNGVPLKGTNFSVKTTYKVGDTFLGADDPSNLIIGAVEDDGSINSVSVALNGSQALFNVSPLPGTRFDSVGYQEVTVRSIFDSSKFYTYSIKVIPNVDYKESTENLRLKPYKLTSDFTYEVSGVTVNCPKGSYVLVDAIYVGNQNGELPQLSLANKEGGDGVQVYGYLKNVNDKDNAGIVVLFHDYIPLIQGDSNISVKFPCYDPESSDFVNKCRFGARFGHNNSLNRLFLSGNPDMPNYDIHSDEPNMYNQSEEDIHSVEGDFSYFPDEAMAKYGEGSNSIVGYDVVSENKMLVLKSKSGNERTIYFRTPQQTTMLSSTGMVQTSNGESLVQEEYATYMSNSPIAGVSPYTIANFNGDTLFVSTENNVMGLDIEGIVGDSQRQANSRSMFIDDDFKAEALDNSTLFTAGAYCYFSTDKALYVAHRDSYKSESRQYEWWKLDPTHARIYFEGQNGQVFFGTEDGSFYRMRTADKYQDTERYFLGASTTDKATIGENGSIVIRDAIADKIGDGWTYKPIVNSDRKKNIYERICSIGEGMALVVENGLLKVPADNAFSHVLRELNESDFYHFCANSTGEFEGASNITALYRNISKFKLVQVYPLDGDGLAYYEVHLYSVDGKHLNKIDVNVTKGGLARMITEETDIAKTDGGDLVLVRNGKRIAIADMYSSIGGSVDCELTKRTNIVSEFITAPLLADSANYMKSVYKIDIINGTKLPTDLNVALVGNNTVFGKKFKGIPMPDGTLQFDFSTLSFASTTFSQNNVPRAYSLRRFFPKQRFFSLAFRSESDKNSVLPGAEITYSYVGLSKGSN